MKKIIFVLLVVLPVLGFGQENKASDLRIVPDKKYLITDIIPLAKQDILKKMKPKPQKWDGRIIDMPTISPQNNYVYIVDGVEMDKDFNLDEFSLKNIKSIDILKESMYINIYGNTEGTIVITIQKVPEYETIVFAPGYEIFLATQKSKDFYSESYLKTKNIQMVNEWNYRCNVPSIYNPKIYEASIDYNAQTDYGIDVEYELYMFFRFMEKENKMSLISDIARL